MASDSSDPPQRRRAAARAATAGRPRRDAGRARRTPGLSIAIVDGHGRPQRAPGLSRWIRDTVPASVRGQVSIALVGDTRMRRLNRTYRGADYATDVLSFPAEDTGLQQAAVTSHETYLGDIVIATGVAARQAHERGHAVATELRILALHGLLHLLGHDHERDRGEMAAVERRLRRKGGLGAGLIERGTRR